MTPRRPQLCFLLGAPRSGTTWIQRLMQAHPAICGGEESHFFNLFGGALATADKWTARDRRRIGPLLYIDRESYEELFRGLWDGIFARLYAENPQALVHLEKTPFHCLSLNEIVRLFPDAKIVFLVRDSRAVVSSLLDAASSWGKHWAPETPYAAAMEWRRHVTAVRRWRAANPAHPFLEVHYEDAAADPEAALERMLRFALPEGADLALAETLARFGAEERARHDPDGFVRVRGVEGWRRDLTAWQKLVVWRYTRKTMQELGYDTSPF